MPCAPYGRYLIRSSVAIHTKCFPVPSGAWILPRANRLPPDGPLRKSFHFSLLTAIPASRYDNATLSEFYWRRVGLREIRQDLPEQQSSRYPRSGGGICALGRGGSAGRD